MTTPRFIVLEGLDGSGKSTQISLLSQKLTALGLPHTTTREPSTGPIGALAREAVHSSPLENETLALLFAADRYQHVTDVVNPALNQGKYVLCDRFYYSNLAYQADNPEALARVLTYNQAVMALRRPDITFFLDVDPEECMRRILERKGKTAIYENLTRLRQDRERFLNAFNRLDDNIVILDCKRDDENVVFGRLWQHLDMGLGDTPQSINPGKSRP